jgi:hypothetical protein
MTGINLNQSANTCALIADQFGAASDRLTLRLTHACLP